MKDMEYQKMEWILSLVFFSLEPVPRLICNEISLARGLGKSSFQILMGSAFLACLLLTGSEQDSCSPGDSRLPTQLLPRCLTEQNAGTSILEIKHLIKCPNGMFGTWERQIESRSGD